MTSKKTIRHRIKKVVFTVSTKVASRKASLLRKKRSLLQQISNNKFLVKNSLLLRLEKFFQNFSAPVACALFCGIMMSVICYLGIKTVDKTQNAQLIEQNNQEEFSGMKRPIFLPLTKIERSTEGQESEGSVSIKKVPEELQHFPYEELQHESFADKVQYSDYALSKAIDLAKISPKSMRVSAKRLSRLGEESFTHLTYDVLPGSTERVFIESLRQALAIWNPEADLRSANNHQWEIYQNKVNTHLIRLYPGRKKFKKGSSVEPEILPERPRHKRKSGEPAKIVIVVDDLGANPSAIDRLLVLNYPVTFAFWPYGEYTKKYAEIAHNAGKEILLHMPMEPLGYPDIEPGDGALFSNMGKEEVIEKVTDALGKVPYAVGLNNHMGSKFTQNIPLIREVAFFAKQRGLFILDSLTHWRSFFYQEAGEVGARRFQRSVFLDVTPTRKAIRKELRKAENIANLTGQCIVIGHPLAQTLSVLEEWQKKRNKAILVVRLQDLE